MIRLECLSDVGGIVVLIHGRDGATFDAMLASLRSLASEEAREVKLHEVPGVVASDGCRVVATNRQGRPGIWAQSATGSFRWSQDAEGWLQIVELAEPVCRSVGESGAHFQDLEVHGDAMVILSTERGW
jgi:hypothetical protein